MKSNRAAVSVVVLTFNEERNLEDCLASVTEWADEMVVVDSGSTDRTLEIAHRFGAQVVTHAFETHARQWQWALATVPLRNAWVLGIDADQRLTPRLREEIRALIESGSDTAGAFVPRRQIFRGSWIRFGGYYPVYLLKVFRRDRVNIDVSDLVDHHFCVSGPTVKLRGDLIEANANESEIAVWTAKHNRYAVLQARQEYWGQADRVPITALFGSPDRRIRYLKCVWHRLPLFVRPCLYVFYRYVLRLGFLDGKNGFIFHVLQGFWYRLLVDANIDELRSLHGVAPDRADRLQPASRPLNRAERSSPP